SSHFSHRSFIMRLSMKPPLMMLFVLVLATPAAFAAQTVTNTNDSGAGSLRNAIATAAGTDVIVFQGVTGTIRLLTPLSIDKNLTITGPGFDKLTVSGGNVIQVLAIGTILNAV